MPKQPIYQFYCRLQEADILTYRIIQVPKSKTLAQLGYILTWIIHLGIWDMKSHLAGLKATFGALRILTERRSW